MKKILFLGGVLILLTTVGCIVPEGGRYEGERHDERHDEHSEVIVGPPIIVAHSPEIIVH